MIYGFVYLFMILSITFIWVFFAIFKKPDFIENFRKLFKNNLKGLFKLKGRQNSSKV